MSEWFDLPGAEDKFELTRDGLVRSKHRYVNSPICGGGRRRIGGRIIKTKRANSYAVVDTQIDGKRRTIMVHRALASLFLPNPDSKPYINHIDGNKENNAISNLEWCTHLENMRHAYRTGLAKYPKTGPGEDSPSAKLDNTAVRDIRARAAAGERQRDIAAIYGVAQGTICFIVRRVTWSHVE